MVRFVAKLNFLLSDEILLGNTRIQYMYDQVKYATVHFVFHVLPSVLSYF